MILVAVGSFDASTGNPLVNEMIKKVQIIWFWLSAPTHTWSLSPPLLDQNQFNITSSVPDQNQFVTLTLS